MNAAPTPTTDVLIVGAGIAGLTLARALRASGRSVTLLEAAPAVGGVIRSERVDGFLCEKGPNSMLVKEARILSWIRELGLGERITVANPAASRRFIVRGGRLQPVPFSLPSAVSTRLFSWPAKLRLLKEPWVRPSGLEDESVARFVRRRLGSEFLDYAVGPMTSGVYAGDPEQLSIRYAFPKVWSLESRSGSLVRGSLQLARERRRSGLARFKPPLISFRDGLGELTARLRASVDQDLRLTALLSGLEKTGEGLWRAHWQRADAGESGLFRELVLTISPHQWQRLIWPSELRDALSRLPEISYPPVSTMTLGFRRSAIAHPLDGFGLLVPHSEGFPFLGCLFSSTLFPDRAPAEHLALTLFRGGAVSSEQARLPEEEAVRETLPGLDRLLGVREAPVFQQVTTWERAIPQYNVGHGRFVRALESLESRYPGLHFLGNYRGGPGLSDRIGSALDLAARLTDDHAQAQS